ncbi:MAG: heavy metal translocating P-type ATPase [Pirellulaceae bacterium]
MAKVELRIHGMDCAEEVATLKARIRPMPGVEELAFNILERRLTVTYADALLTEGDLIRAIGQTGMRAEPYREIDAIAHAGTYWDRWGRTVLTMTSGAAILAGFLAHAGTEGWRAAIGGHASALMPWAVRVLYLLAIVSGVWYVAPKAFSAARRRRPDMNLLMTLAVIGAILIGEWLEAATVSFLFALSLALESWSVGRARRAIAALMGMAPPQARLIRSHGDEALIPVEDVAVGSRIVVRPGERIPLDGRVTSGRTSVNQAPITGESMPASKAVGDEVFAGTVNQDGAIEVVTTKAVADSMISQIVRMVREAQSKRSPSEQWVEKFSHYYTPTVIGLAIVVAVVPPLMVGSPASWFYRALVLLVIACPCALVISTPVSIVAALAAAARRGVLIKGGVYVELPSRLKAIALDKTGTLTEGHPRVTRLIPLNGHDERELLEIAAAIELRSEHPLGRAVVRYAAEQGIRPAPVEDYQAVPGRGATAVLRGRPVWIGSHRYLEQRGHDTPEMQVLLENLSATGSSVVAIGEDHHVCGFVALADQLRPDAADTIRAIKNAGVGHVMMLTGDNLPTAQAIAHESGVDEFRAELLPQDKVAVIEELVRRYGTVGMVGDGVNDAPALARSSLGIAMGVAGSAAAMETADIALMTDDLARLPWLIHYSHRVLRIIRQNIIAALAVKALFVLLTLLGHASLWAAIAADMGVSLLVVLNALRLLSGALPAPSPSAPSPIYH